MEMTVQTQGFALTSAIYRRTRSQLDSALTSFRDAVVSVDVYLKDVNGPKGGVDKVALVRIHLTTQQTLAIETTNANLDAAILLTARRAKRTVRRTLGKRRRLERARHGLVLTGGYPGYC